MADEIPNKVVLTRPENWDKMTREQKVEWSRQFLARVRSSSREQ